MASPDPRPHHSFLSITARLVQRGALASFVTLGVVSTGCVNTQQAAAITAPQRAVGPVSDLHASIRVISDSPEVALGQQYAAALRWAGVTVVPTVAEADVVTELRLSRRDERGAGQTVDVSLEVRAGKERLASARVNFPVAKDAPKDDLSVLTAAFTESPAVRAFADRVAVEKAKRAELADEGAWKASNAATCANSPELRDCSEVIRYLNGFPLGRHRAEAEATLAQAEGVRFRAARDAAIERVKTDLGAWKTANAAACATPQGPTSCDGVSAYLVAHPQGRFAVEANELLRQSQAKLAELQQQEQLQNAMSQRRAKATARR